MATSIYEFSSALNASARPNQFKVHINFPAGLVSNGATAKNAASFLIHQASLPGYTTEDIQIYFRGRQFHEAGEKQYQTWSCTVYNSSDFKVRTAFEQWVNAIHDPEVVAGITRPETYKTTVMIEQLDRNDQTLRVYKLVGAYPTDLGGIELGFENGTNIETFQLTFAYDYFIVGGAEILENTGS